MLFEDGAHFSNMYHLEFYMFVYICLIRQVLMTLFCSFVVVFLVVLLLCLRSTAYN
jgi:1,4-dihydroxy-2-naphthoate octaprenyltransferase